MRGPRTAVLSAAAATARRASRAFPPAGPTRRCARGRRSTCRGLRRSSYRCAGGGAAAGRGTGGEIGIGRGSGYRGWIGVRGPGGGGVGGGGGGALPTGSRRPGRG